MTNIEYQIESVWDRNENELKNTFVDDRWLIKAMGVGYGAVLLNFTDIDKSLRTSPVEDVTVFENTIRLRTKNTEYWLKPYARKEAR